MFATFNKSCHQYHKKYHNFLLKDSCELMRPHNDRQMCYDFCNIEIMLEIHMFCSRILFK